MKNMLPHQSISQNKFDCVFDECMHRPPDPDLTHNRPHFPLLVPPPLIKCCGAGKKSCCQFAYDGGRGKKRFAGDLDLPLPPSSAAPFTLFFARTREAARPPRLLAAAVAAAASRLFVSSFSLAAVTFFSLPDVPVFPGREKGAFGNNSWGGKGAAEAASIFFPSRAATRVPSFLSRSLFLLLSPLRNNSKERPTMLYRVLSPNRTTSSADCLRRGPSLTSILCVGK